MTFGVNLLKTRYQNGELYTRKNTEEFSYSVEYSRPSSNVMLFFDVILLSKRKLVLPQVIDC
jgi:hypothetical protein